MPVDPETGLSILPPANQGPLGGALQIGNDVQAMEMAKRNQAEKMLQQHMLETQLAQKQDELQRQQGFEQTAANWQGPEPMGPEDAVQFMTPAAGAQIMEMAPYRQQMAEAAQTAAGSKQDVARNRFDQIYTNSGRTNAQYADDALRRGFISQDEAQVMKTGPNANQPFSPMAGSVMSEKAAKAKMENAHADYYEQHNKVIQQGNAIKLQIAQLRAGGSQHLDRDISAMSFKVGAQMKSTALLAQSLGNVIKDSETAPDKKLMAQQLLQQAFENLKENQDQLNDLKAKKASSVPQPKDTDTNTANKPIVVNGKVVSPGVGRFGLNLPQPPPQPTEPAG